MGRVSMTGGNQGLKQSICHFVSLRTISLRRGIPLQIPVGYPNLAFRSETATGFAELTNLLR